MVIEVPEKFRAERRLLCLAVLLFASAPVYASLWASPNPSTGSYTVEWGGVNGGYSYTLYETFDGTTTSYNFFSSTTFEKSFSGKAIGFYTYTLYVCWNDGPYPTFDPENCDYIGDPLTVRVRPKVPGGLTAPSIDYNGDYTVSWNAATGATLYQLQERFNSGSWSTVHSGSARTKARWNRSPGSWSYRVRACAGSTNCSAWSGSITVSVPSPPAAPTGLTAPSTDYDGSYTVSWNASSGASSYRLEEKIGSTWTQIYSGSLRSQSLERSPGSYAYRVVACMPESVCGSWSGSVAVDVQGPPGTPNLSGPSEPVRHDETYTIWWTDTDPVFYELQEKAPGGIWEPVSLDPGSLSETLSNVPGTYLYQVQACNPEDVCSGWSASISVTVKLVYTTTYEYDALGRLIEVEQQ